MEVKGGREALDSPLSTGDDECYFCCESSSTGCGMYPQRTKLPDGTTCVGGYCDNVSYIAPPLPSPPLPSSPLLSSHLILHAPFPPSSFLRVTVYQPLRIWFSACSLSSQISAPTHLVGCALTTILHVAIPFCMLPFHSVVSVPIPDVPCFPSVQVSLLRRT